MDRRGSSTIPALFAAAFLVAGVYYLYGLGDAMVYHETMRDAADATAFAPSVMQARGMNVLALVNLVMSAILAVLVAVKIVQLLLLAANVIACALPFNPICPMLSSWESPFDRFVKLTDRAVSLVNKGLYKAESAVAKTIPIVAEGKAEAVSRDYEPIVDQSYGASATMTSGELEAISGGSLGGFPTPGGGLGGGGGAGRRFGLPVEDEPYEDLCVQASQEVKGILFKPLKFLPGSSVIVGPIMKLAGGLIDKLVRAFPSWFCGGGGAGGLGALGGDFASLAKDLAKKGVSKIAGGLCKDAPASPPGVPSCAAGVSAAISGIAGGSSIKGQGQTSKRVYRPAVIGSDYYTTFGLVTSSYLEDYDVDGHLAAISWDHLPKDVLRSQLDEILMQSQVSKSEFYYDPRKGGPTAWLGGVGAGGGCLRDESLLNMRWRARLRKYRPPVGEPGRLVTGAGLGSILRTISASRGHVPSPALVLRTILGGGEGLSRWGDVAAGAPIISRSTGGILH